LRIGDKHKFAEEETRLKSLDNILNQVGFQEYLYEQFAEDTYELLRDTAATIGLANGGALLLAAFNDDTRSKSIITYFKACPSLSTALRTR
jgi:ubiquitin thioesterase protein OTUB1